MDLLKQLYCIHSKSMQEKKIRLFICRWITDNVPGAKVENENGNLLVTKGRAKTYPCIVAHLDQVQTMHSPDFSVIENNGVLFGYSASNRRQEGLGADDKNGIYIALKCLQEYDAIKIALFRGEEIGCVGSSEVDLTFFADCRYLIQCDRRGGHDFIVDASGVELSSDEFIADCNLESFGYRPEYGMMTDVMTLKERGVNCSCVNLSCGYYHPHTDSECTVISELENCLDFVRWIITNLTGVYLHAYVDQWKYGYNNAKNDSFFGNKNYTDESCWEMYNYMYDLVCDNPGASFDDIFKSYGDWFGYDRETAELIYDMCIEDAEYNDKSELP